ncbi:MAG: thermonuclease family protein [Anaerolineae bacterium]|jgi:endonuclease YncB( thermonuclease family)|nr:thermonuclease family protein [Anaerolineae bacterium]
MKNSLLILLSILAFTSLACEISAADIEQLLDLLPTPAPYSGPDMDVLAPMECLLDQESDFATVTYIYDGETIQVELDGEKYKVRLIGINTPEIDEFYSTEATQSTASMLPIGTEVQLFQDTSGTDQYGRLLRYVLKDDVFLNHYLVLHGFAYAKSYRPDTACDAVLQKAMELAMQEQVGIFQP